MGRNLDKDSDRAVTVLGKETFFSGVLHFTDELRILGAFEGTIEAEGNLYIEKNSVCNVNHISASSVVISGKVTGDVVSHDRLELHSGSELHGNVTASKLRIADDVLFEGQVSMIQNKREIDIFSAKGSEIKDSLR